MLTIGERAPAFTLSDQDGNSVRLPNNQWTLIYFYPKDDTPGCTKEACGIRDNYADLKNLVTIYGVSKDSVTSHQKFAQKYGLPFTLLADPDLVVIKAFQAWGQKKFMGKAFDGVLRVSYLINPENHIAKVYPNVKPEKHAQEILEDMHQLKSA